MNNEQRVRLNKFLTGECSAHELAEVQLLLDTPAGRSMLQQLMEERDLAAREYTLPGAGESDLDAKLQGLKRQVNERIAAAGENEASPIRRLPVFRNVAIWAGVLLAGSVTVWQVRKAIVPKPVLASIRTINPGGVPVRHVLPDSSIVFLAGGSTITYPGDYPRSGRDVTLTGAAFFDVTRDEAHPFIIHTGNVQATVLGTSFRVSAFDNEPLEVAVATGKVGVSAGTGSTQQQLATLTPGVKVRYDPSTGRSLTSPVDINSLELWRSGDLVFDELPLNLVAHALKRRFGVTVTCDDTQTANYKVSGTFSAGEPVKEVLQSLSSLGKFRYKAQGDSIFHLFKTEEGMQQ